MPQSEENQIHPNSTLSSSDSPVSNLEYTVIDHTIQKALGLSLNEYCIANSIYILSTNPKNPNNGWCSATNEMLAKRIGVTERTITTIIKSLEVKGIIEFMPECNRRLKRTTDRWNSYFYPVEESSTLKVEKTSTSKKKLLPKVEETSTLRVEETSDYSNNIYNNIYNNILPSTEGSGGDPPKEYGDPDVNLLMREGLTILGISTWDGSIKENRKNAKIAINKFRGTNPVLAILKASTVSDFWQGNVTSFADVLKHGNKIMNSIVHQQSRGGVTYVE